MKGNNLLKDSARLTAEAVKDRMRSEVDAVTLALLLCSTAQKRLVILNGIFCISFQTAAKGPQDVEGLRKLQDVTKASLKDLGADPLLLKVVDAQTNYAIASTGIGDTTPTESTLATPTPATPTVPPVTLPNVPQPHWSPQ